MSCQIKENELFMSCHIQKTAIAKLLKTTEKQRKIITHISIITHCSKSRILRKSRAVRVHVHRSRNESRTVHNKGCWQRLFWWVRYRRIVGLIETHWNIIQAQLLRRAFFYLFSSPSHSSARFLFRLPHFARLTSFEKNCATEKLSLRLRRLGRIARHKGFLELRA